MRVCLVPALLALISGSLTGQSNLAVNPSKVCVLESFVTQNSFESQTLLEASERLFQENPSRLVLIEHHLDDPLESSVSRARAGAYNLPAPGAVFLDGRAGLFIGNSASQELEYNRIKPVLDAQLALENTLDLTLTWSAVGTDFTATLKLTNLGSSDLAGKTLRTFLLAVSSTPGETRRAIEQLTAIKVDLLKPSQSQEWVLIGVLPTDDANKFQLVSFVQDDKLPSKPIMQGALGELVPATRETEPPGGFFQELTWFSFPLEPLDPDPASIFGFDRINGRLHWMAPDGTDKVYPTDFTTVIIGEVYHLYLTNGYNPKYTGYVPVKDKEVLLEKAGKNWVGVPLDSARYIRNLTIRNNATQEIRTALEDATNPAPWMDWKFYWWDNSQNIERFNSLDGEGGVYYSLNPWWGYYCTTYTDNLSLIFPNP